MVPIAIRNLLHERLRLVTALAGVIFSVLLVTSLSGLYVAGARNASGIVDHAAGDIWIVAHGTRTLELSEPISRRYLYQACSAPGVLWAEPLLVQFSQWRTSEGRQEIVQIVGVESNSKLGLPWAMAEGEPDCVRHDDGVIIDVSDRRRFGKNHQLLDIGDTAEILSTRARVAGFSKGVRSFTTFPYVFTTHKRALENTAVEEGQTKALVIKAAPGVSLKALQEQLRVRLPELDVWTKQEFAKSCRNYWLFSTGIGTEMIFSALLGLLVGCVILSQTIHAATVSRLGEYGTLKAMGMENYQIAGIIIKQALLIGLVGYAGGGTLTFLLSLRLSEWNLSVDLPFWLIGTMLLITLVTCTVASITSVTKVFRLAPATVFRG